MGPELSWSLPGGAIHSKKDELFQDAVYRIIRRNIPDIEIGEIHPIAYLEKGYRCVGEEITHRGITFMCRVRQPSREAIKRDENIKGRFISIDDSAEIKRICPFDKELFELAKFQFEDPLYNNDDAIEDEIQSYNRISRLARWFHWLVIHPVGKRFSSNIIKEEILKYINPEEYVLDIACGDDQFIWQVSNRVALCVGNDINWKIIKKLITNQEKGHPDKTTLFTNHDACNLPFRKRFDLVLCKNVLHHMRDKQQLEALLSTLRSVAKRILIVDPDDPANGLLPRMWHFYYVNILKDQGEKFFTKSFMERTVREFYHDALDIEVRQVPTIKGHFTFCYITYPDDDFQDLSVRAKASRKDFIFRDIMSDVKVVIFDFDGLLFNTERLFFTAIANALKRREIKIRERDYIRSDLQKGIPIIQEYIDKGLLTGIEVIQKEIYDEYSEMISRGVAEMPGAKRLISSYYGKYNLAIATSSRRRYVNQILVSHNISDKFDHIVSRENVKYFKPDPGCLRDILNKFKVKPNECVLIEDSERGLSAAKSIGMKCIIVRNDMTIGGNFYGADLILSSLEEMLKLNECIPKE
jgi:HAD superfamily hydrolase (TIGR01509 family)